MRTSKLVFYPAILLAALLLLAIACCGCGGGTPSSDTGLEQVPTQSGETAVSADPYRTVTMNGRSVMEGWMKHWGYAWEGAVSHNGYYLDYKTLDSSSIGNLAGSFAENTSGLPAGSVVFFKFCFVDFTGEPGNLTELEAVVDKVIKTSGERGYRLIVGNALPTRGEWMSPGLRQEYSQYNAFLQQKAAENPNVWVFDFYGILAGSDGGLKPSYDSGDGHPNEAGYSALDPTFFELLQKIYAGQ